MKNNLLKKASVSFLIIVLIIGSMMMTNVRAEDNYSITIDNSVSGHQYEAYQIFKGTISAGGDTLSDIKWGNGVNPSTLLEELKKDNTLKDDFSSITYTSENDTSARLVAEKLATYNDNDTKLKVFAQVVEKCLNGTGSSFSFQENKYTVSGLSAGYYFIRDKKDSQDNKYDTYTRYVLKLTNNTYVTPKTVKPSVDKSFVDGTDVAEYAINEKFSFKLKATLPGGDEGKEFTEYNTYKLVFEDTMGKGISFDNNLKVEVKAKKTEDGTEETFTVSDSNKYSVTEPSESSNKLEVTITNLKDILGTTYDITKGVEVIVTYDAHLNSKATVTKSGANLTINATETADSEQNSIGNNVNNVVLKYSNEPNKNSDNPNAMGITTSDNVYVFTYGVDNTKSFDNIEETNKESYPEAGFRLYKDGTEVELIYDETLKAYRPVDKSKSESATEMKSNTTLGKGQFNIVGLGAGTYTLKETTTPNGYNTCENITITITTSLTENNDGLSATASFTSNTGMNNAIINKHGASLPSTGAMALVIICAAAAVLGVGGLMLSKDKKED